VAELGCIDLYETGGIVTPNQAGRAFDTRPFL